MQMNVEARENLPFIPSSWAGAGGLGRAVGRRQGRAGLGLQNAGGAMTRSCAVRRGTDGVAMTNGAGWSKGWAG